MQSHSRAVRAAVLAALAVTGLLRVSPLAAQMDGTPIRVQTEARPGKWLTGVVAGVTADSIGIARTLGPVRKRSHDTVYVARNDLARMEMSQGQKNNAGRGALIGGAVFGGLRLALGIACTASTSDNDMVGCEASDVPKMAAGSALFGAFLGAIFGALSHRGRWVGANEAAPFSVIPSVMPGGYRKSSVALAIQYRGPPRRR